MFNSPARVEPLCSPLMQVPIGSAFTVLRPNPNYTRLLHTLTPSFDASAIWGNAPLSPKTPGSLHVPDSDPDFFILPARPPSLAAALAVQSVSDQRTLGRALLKSRLREQQRQAAAAAAAATSELTASSQSPSSVPLASSLEPASASAPAPISASEVQESGVLCPPELSFDPTLLDAPLSAVWEHYAQPYGHSVPLLPPAAGATASPARGGDVEAHAVAAVRALGKLVPPPTAGAAGNDGDDVEEEEDEEEEEESEDGPRVLHGAYVPSLSALQIYVIDSPAPAPAPAPTPDAAATASATSTETDASVTSAAPPRRLPRMPRLLLDFFERLPPHLRPPLLTRVRTDLEAQCPRLASLRLSDLDRTRSWFAVSWSPVLRAHRNPPWDHGTFITYHSFEIVGPSPFIPPFFFGRSAADVAGWRVPSPATAASGPEPSANPGAGSPEDCSSGEGGGRERYSRDVSFDLALLSSLMPAHDATAWGPLFSSSECNATSTSTCAGPACAPSLTHSASVPPSVACSPSLLRRDVFTLPLLGVVTSSLRAAMWFSPAPPPTIPTRPAYSAAAHTAPTPAAASGPASGPASSGCAPSPSTASVATALPPPTSALAAHEMALSSALLWAFSPRSQALLAAHARALVAAAAASVAAAVAAKQGGGKAASTAAAAAKGPQSTQTGGGGASKANDDNAVPPAVSAALLRHLPATLAAEASPTAAVAAAMIAHQHPQATLRPLAPARAANVYVGGGGSGADVLSADLPPKTKGSGIAPSTTAAAKVATTATTGSKGTAPPSPALNANQASSSSGLRAGPSGASQGGSSNTSSGVLMSKLNPLLPRMVSKGRFGVCFRPQTLHRATTLVDAKLPLYSHDRAPTILCASAEGLRVNAALVGGLATAVAAANTAVSGALTSVPATSGASSGFSLSMGTVAETSSFSATTAAAAAATAAAAAACASSAAALAATMLDVEVEMDSARSGGPLLPQQQQPTWLCVLPHDATLLVAADLHEYLHLRINVRKSLHPDLASAVRSYI